MLGCGNGAIVCQVNPLSVDLYPVGKLPGSLAAKIIPLCRVKFFAQICIPFEIFVGSQLSPPFVERYIPVYAPVKSAPLCSYTDSAKAYIAPLPTIIPSLFFTQLEAKSVDLYIPSSVAAARYFPEKR